jgi:hypothetical protein
VVVGLGFKGEDLFDGASEGAGDEQGQGEGGDVAVALDGIDALAGDAGAGGEVFLRPVESLAEFADAVVEGGGHGKSAFHTVAAWGKGVKSALLFFWS